MVEGINSYVSTAIFTAEEVGTYFVKYTITMAAGKSHVRFIGEETTDSIEVEEEVDLAIDRHTVQVISIVHHNNNFDRVTFIVSAYFNNGYFVTTENITRNISKNVNQEIYNVPVIANGEEFPLSVAVSR